MTVAEKLQFDRKHYFYHDLPAGYQITQERFPVCRQGFLDVEVPTSSSASARDQSTYTTRVNIERLQLEHDSAKSIHTASEYTLVDLNRAGR